MRLNFRRRAYTHDRHAACARDRLLLLHVAALLELAPVVLQRLGGDVLLLAALRARDGRLLVVLRVHLLELLLNVLHDHLELLRVLHRAELVAHDGLGDVERVALLALVDRDVERDELNRVRLGQLEGPVELVAEVGKVLERHELGGLRIVALPCREEHRHVVLRDAHLLLLVRLCEVLEDHRDVHVDEDEAREAHERYHHEDRQPNLWTRAHVHQPVAVRQLHFARVTVWRLDCDGREHLVPAAAGHQLELDEERVRERAVVEHLVEARRDGHQAERLHADDRVYVDEQEEEDRDVDERRQRGHQRVQQIADAARRPHEAQHPPDPEHAEDTQQRRTDGQRLDAHLDDNALIR